MYRHRNPLPKKYQHIIKRMCLVIRIPNAMVPDLCDLMECKHDHQRRIVMQFICEGIERAKRRKANAER